MTSQLWPRAFVKKPDPSTWWNPERLPKSRDDGLNRGRIARSVRGIIDSRPSTGANMAPSRIPYQAGTNTSRMPMIEITTVQYEIGVWIGVKPFVDRSNFSLM